MRSAEAEHGPHALLLSAVQETDDDVLILRARNAKEMSEWLFQLHRGIEVWVKNIMSTSLYAAVGDIIIPKASAAWLSPRPTRLSTSGGSSGAEWGPFLLHAVASVDTTGTSHV